MPVGRSLHHRAIKQSRLIVVGVAAVLIALGPQGCGGTPATTTPPSPTQPRATATQTGQAGLPSLSTDSGYHAVVDLSGGTTGEANAATFAASKPYTIKVACAGTGSVTVTFAPQGSIPLTCTPAGTSTTDQVGTAQNPPQNQQITVSIAPSGQVTWHVLIQLAN